MSVGSARKTLTVRLPAALYETVRRLAARRKTSVNAAIEQALAQVARSAQQSELYEAFGQVGLDADVGFAWEAQLQATQESRQRRVRSSRRSSR